MTVHLPIDELLPAIRESLREIRHLVIVSPPGSGKTTRVPPALVEDGRVILLQPRRVAARSLARRIAYERGWTLGEKIGWQIRHDRRYSIETELLVCTEGILTARLQTDPLLANFRTVILDEFHERSIHADLALALAAQAAEARGDLRIVVMSATLDPAPIVAFLGGASSCAVIEGKGALHPVEIRYRPEFSSARAIDEMLSATSGDVLTFLPGKKEIEDVRRELDRSGEVEIVTLHGSLSPREQDDAITPGDRRKVILSTNIAETSLTVEGVEAVVDSGMHKIIRYDADSGLDRLVAERIPEDAADQRAGRAGRLTPGIAVRLWDERDILRPRREPEIHRIDLAPVILDVLRWGDDPHSFRWFEAPAADRIESGLDLLREMGAVDPGKVPKLSRIGQIMQRLPIAPRLGRILIESKGSEQARRACAAIAEGIGQPESPIASESDLLHLADAGRGRQLARISSEMKSILENAGVDLQDRQTDREFLRSILTGYPDRVARRRSQGSDRYQLYNGQGAILSRRSTVVGAEWLVAIGVRGGGPGREAWIEIASRIERDWLSPDSVEIVHELDEEGRRVQATELRRYGALVLSEQSVPPDPAIAARILVDAFVHGGLGEENERLLRRARFAGLEPDVESVARSALAGKTAMSEIRIADWLSWEERRQLDHDAPPHIEIPSGRRVNLEYREDGSVVASAKLQELFGLTESPKIGPEGTPVTIDLLAPNGRSVQLTSDLKSFWKTTYRQVRKELRGRYPKHPWPEDPSSAEATARTKKQMGKD